MQKLRSLAMVTEHELHGFSVLVSSILIFMMIRAEREMLLCIVDNADLTEIC